MSRASGALKRLADLAKKRAKADVHTDADAYAVLDVDYLYRLVLERQAKLGEALRNDGNLEAPIDDAYVDRIWNAAADVAIAVGYLADRVTPRKGGILPSSEHRGAVMQPKPNRAERRAHR